MIECTLVLNLSPANIATKPLPNEAALIFMKKYTLAKSHLLVISVIKNSLKGATWRNTSEHILGTNHSAVLNVKRNLAPNKVYSNMNYFTLIRNLSVALIVGRVLGIKAT